jgi:hypothetical protein
MTVNSTEFFTDWVATDGVNKNFSYDFSIFAVEDIKVYIREGLDGTETEYTSGFTFTPNDSTFAGGYVTYPSSGDAIASGFYVRIVRDVAFLQTAEIGNEGSFRPSIHERVFDKLTMQMQQVANKADRAFVTPLGTAGAEIVAPFEENKALVYSGGKLVFGPTIAAIEGAQAAGLVAAEALAVISPISDEITALAAVSDDISTLASIAAQITALGAISASISAVAVISANVTTVAAIADDITELAVVATSIPVVAGIADEISDLAAIVADITTVASISADITAAPAAAASAAASAIAAAESAASVDMTALNEAIALKADLNIAVVKTSDTGAAALPAGTTAQRPGSPETGYTRFNSSLGYPEFWDGSTWERYQGPAGADGDPGAAGDDGADGAVIHFVTSAPASDLGVVGDWAFRNDGNVYQKTGASTWTLRDNITGPTGATGPAGTPSTTYGSIGSYAGASSNGSFSAGQSVGGANFSPPLSGTWRVMGNPGTGAAGITYYYVLVRIS